MAPSHKERLLLEFNQLETERSSYLSHWRDINDFTLPRRGKFSLSDTNKGNQRSRFIIDSTATWCAGILAAGMHSGVSSQARPWYRLTTEDPELAEYAPVRDYLWHCQQHMLSVMLRSNIYKILPMMYKDDGVFGTAAVLMKEEDKEILHYKSLPIGSYMIANNHLGQVNTLMREIRMSVLQVVEQFGLAKVSDPIRREYERGNYRSPIDIIHAVTPNLEYDSTKLGRMYKEFYGCYFEKGSDKEADFLEEAGFDEFPFLCPRWEVNGEDSYGSDCPGMTALGDVKQLQQGERRAGQAIDLMVRPAMSGPTALRSAKASILPGDMTYVDVREGQRGFEPIFQIDPKIQELEGKQEQVRGRIKQSYHTDLFMTIAMARLEDRDDVTAREIAERHEEKMIALGPVLENITQDGLDPLINRNFKVLNRRGLLPPPPPELEGLELKVEYISIMHQAQKMVGLGGLDRFAAFGVQLATVDPSVLDKWDRDQSMDTYAEMTGIPPHLIVPDEQVAEVRKARAAAAQAQAQAAQLKDLSTSAKTLSQTDTTKRSGLTDLMAALGGAP